MKKYWERYEEIGTPTLLGVLWNETAGMENGMPVFQIIKTRIIIWSRNSTSGYIPKRIESRS